MKMSKVLSVLLLVAVFGVQAAYADTLSGKIAGVNVAESSISVSSHNEETHTDETLSVAVSPETVFTGVVTLADLKEGQEVSIEADKNEAGAYAAKSIEVKNAEAVPAELVAPVEAVAEAVAPVAEEAKA